MHKKRLQRLAKQVFIALTSVIVITLLFAPSLNYRVLAKVSDSVLHKTSIVAVNYTDNIERLVEQINQLPDAKDRRDRSFLIRLKAALLQRNNFSLNHPNNGDEQLYASENYIANFTKALPHNELGLVDKSAYSVELKAIETGNFADFEAIPLGGTTKLANPEAAYAFDLEGIDSHGLTIPPAPTFSSAETASEIAEDYWQALTRDVPFSQYDNNPDTQAAASDLSHFSDFHAPKENGQVTTGTLFRADIPGVLTGPYVSQFLWLDVPYGVGVTPNFPTNDGQLGVGSVPVPTNSQQRNFAAPFPLGKLTTTDRGNQHHFITILKDSIWFHKLQVHSKTSYVSQLTELGMFGKQAIAHCGNGCVWRKFQQQFWDSISFLISSE